MNIHSKLFCAAALAGFAFAAASPAQALTAQECSAKYQAAKAAGTLGGQKWNDFRKAQCGADATPAPTAAAPAPAAPKEARKDTTKQAKKEAAPAPAAPAGPAVFPTVVDPKYSKESEGKQRFNTCVDQYRVNKTANANGGMKWIERSGGGYWSECNKKLKGAA